ncbi:MAG: asparagine synthase (glutamine-hydrolyzing) [Pseudonocardia sp.]|nr:asparagine synthase (glutamine-hydrolyzing) [Pseudonocardia sp.]
MCGVTGWIDFERDMRHQRATVRTMAATLANRGPDGEGVWADEHAALGFRRLAVIDREGGAQPMVAEQDNRILAVLVYNGEVYNFRQLRTRLQALGHRFRSRSDTEVVLRSYLQWGERCVEYLDGMFAFAVWDPSRQRLLLARDRLGVKPLYYTCLGNGIVFGSEVKALLAHPLIDAAIDAEGLAELLGYVSTPGRAVYLGMSEVPPGSIVSVDRAAVRTRGYWRLTVREHTDDAETTVATVRGLLEESVTAQLVSDVPLCTLLSGGLDSSAIAAIAHKAGEGSLRTFAVDFEGHTDRFRKDFWHEDPDAPYAAAVAEHVGTDHEPVVLRTAEMTDPVLAANALAAQDLPRPIPDMDRSLHLLLRAVRERSTVALTGEIADELFGGYQSFRDPALLAAGNFPWVAMGFAVAPHGMSTGLLDPGLLRRIDIPGYTAARHAEALAEVPVIDAGTAKDRLMLGVTYLHLTRWLPLLLDRDDRLSMAVGLELRVPYCDHRLVEYAFGIPWSMKGLGGMEKGVLRASVADLLPTSILRRRKSPFPVTQDPGYGQALRDQLEAVFADSSSPVRSMLDTARVDALLRERRPVEATGWGERRDVEMVLQLDAWLRRYRVRIEI